MTGNPLRFEMDNGSISFNMSREQEARAIGQLENVVLDDLRLREALRMITRFVLSAQETPGKEVESTGAHVTFKCNERHECLRIEICVVVLLRKLLDLAKDAPNENWRVKVADRLSIRHNEGKTMLELEEKARNTLLN